MSSTRERLKRAYPDMFVTPGTRHYTLLNSNDELPEDSELLAFLHSVISDANVRLASLEEEIPTIQEKLILLENQSVSLTSYGPAMPRSDADAQLKEELSKIQETLIPLEKEHVSLSSYRARNEAILSPLRRMPPEVLGDIFSVDVALVRQTSIYIGYSSYVPAHPLLSQWLVEGA